MTPERLSASSQLFAVRLWSEDLGDEPVGWRGQVTHVLSGETRHFRAWPDLIDFLWQVVQAGDVTTIKKECEHA